MLSTPVIAASAYGSTPAASIQSTVCCTEGALNVLSLPAVSSPNPSKGTNQTRNPSLTEYSALKEAQRMQHTYYFEVKRKS